MENKKVKSHRDFF